MRCYFLSVCSGSSVDQQSNNATLFNLVEQLNVPPGAPPPPRGLVPLEMHAYFQFNAEEHNRLFDMRFVMVASTGLETPGEIFTHKALSARLRTRTVGLPFPPVTGIYELRVDVRFSGEEGWKREPLAWPIAILEIDPKPRMTH